MRPKRINDVEQLYREHDDLKRDDVLKLLEWCRCQPHLPPIDEFQAMIFLHSCFGSNEAAKVTIDNYYTARKHCPEFFDKRRPFNPEFEVAKKTLLMVPIPKLTPEGYCVIYMRLIDPSPANFHIDTLFKYFDMTSSLLRAELGPTNGLLILVDYHDFTLTHLLKLNPMALKKYLFFLQDALPVRLRGLHYVNAVPFIDKVLALIKPFLKKELMSMLYIHQGDNATLFDHVAKECVPSEAGGTFGSVKSIHGDYLKNFEANADFFQAEETMVVDESKRPGRPKNAGDLFGVEGTFKKLDID